MVVDVHQLNTVHVHVKHGGWILHVYVYIHIAPHLAVCIIYMYTVLVMHYGYYGNSLP